MPGSGTGGRREYTFIPEGAGEGVCCRMGTPHGWSLSCSFVAWDTLSPPIRPSASRTNAAAVTRTFESPWSYDPSYSLLGRALRYWTGDRLRGEALFIVALTGLGLVLLMSHYLGWALLKPALAGNPSWQLLFWAGQLASVAALGAIGLLGVRPGVTVTCTATGIELEQGRRSETVPYDAVEQVDTISATQYHRHYRRYAATQVFVGGLGEAVLLMRTSQGPVAISLADPDEQAALHAHLDTTEAEAPEPVPQPQS